MFHLLIAESTKSFVGTQESHRLLRGLIGRTFAHAEMVRASKAFSEGADGLPATLRALEGASVVPHDLTFVAEALVKLQAERQRADYDVRSGFTRKQVLGIVSLAQRATQAWERAREQPAARLYLLSLFAWNRIPKE